MASPPPSRSPGANPLMDAARATHEALAKGRADLAREPLAVLVAAAPNDPGVQHMARQAAVIGFACEAAREPVQLEARELPDPARIDLVAFHANLPVNPSGIHDARIDYMEILRLSFESAAMRAPKARRLLITDEKTNVPADLPVHEVLRYPLALDKLMYERMRAQSLYLASREAGRLSVLLDSDIVVNAEPAGIFDRAFDLGLSWRKGFPDAPFNGGMLPVSEGQAGPEFFRRALACYDTLADDPGLKAIYPKDLRAWWGDQFAFALLVGYREYAERTTDAERVDGAIVRFLPCDTYNFTLEPGNVSPEHMRPKFFVHFKGNRKQMQAQYVAAMRAGQL